MVIGGAHLAFEVVNVIEPIQAYPTGLRTTADKVHYSILINRSKLNFSILYYSAGKANFTSAKSVHLNIKIYSKINPIRCTFSPRFYSSTGVKLTL